MSKEKISIVKIRAIARMRELGFTVASISELLGISRVTVYDHINPTSYKARLRRTTTSNREKQVTASKHPDSCEVCKTEGNRLYFHVLSKGRPLVGLWLCSSCNTFCDICDNLGTPGILKKAIVYFNLVDQLLPREKEKK